MTHAVCFRDRIRWERRLRIAKERRKSVVPIEEASARKWRNQAREYVRAADDVSLFGETVRPKPSAEQLAWANLVYTPEEQAYHEELCRSIGRYITGQAQAPGHARRIFSVA